jgi:hypothetical protein
MTFILTGVCPLTTFPAYATANFSKGSIVRLLATKDGAYDLACALDFDGVGLYDMLVYLLLTLVDHDPLRFLLFRNLKMVVAPIIPLFN